MTLTPAMMESAHWAGLAILGWIAMLWAWARLSGRRPGHVLSQ